MADIVQERGGDGHPGRVVGNGLATRHAPEVIDSHAREVHDAQGVLEPRVASARPDTGDEAELLNALEPGEGRRVDQRAFWLGDGDAVIEGVPDGGDN